MEKGLKSPQTIEQENLNNVIRSELPADSALGVRPAVTIGMPVYNGEKYICEALDTLLAQTFTDFELIISDNDSTDATESICRNYAEQDPRIRYVRQLKNLGALPNFQFVLNEARGAYFMWAAYDDKWDKDWVRSLKHTLEVSGVGAAFGKLMHIDENSQPLRHPANGRTFEFRGSLLKRRVCYFIGFERYGKANPIYSLFRREALRGLELDTYTVDFHIVFAILLKTEIASAPGTTLYKRVHPASGGSARAHAGLASFLRRWLDLFISIDMGFILGYFRYGSLVERMLFAILLPIKIFWGYVFYLDNLALIIRSRYFDYGRTSP